MNQTFDLEKLGFTLLDNEEMGETGGGVYDPVSWDVVFKLIDYVKNWSVNIGIGGTAGIPGGGGGFAF